MATAPGTIDVRTGTSVTRLDGDKAVLAIAQRGGEDFMIGCTTQTVGDGDLPLPISMTLVNLSTPVPPTTCVSVGDFCAERCQ